MQYSKVAFLAALLAPLAAAQNLSGLPSCALTPAISALGSTGCALTDVKCICDNTKFLQSLQTTVEAVCSPADLATALQFAETLCLSAGVTLVISTPAPATTTAAPATTTSAMMTTTPVPSTTLTTTVPMTTAMVSSMAMTTSATPSSVVIVSVISDGQPQVPTNATVLTTPTIAPFKGAAANNKAQLGGVAMLVGAVGAIFAL